MEPPSMEDKYDVIRKLGQGTFGVASLVRRRQVLNSCGRKPYLGYPWPNANNNIIDNKLFVSKSISLELAGEKEREATLKEIRVLRAMHHPCIVQFEEAFEQGGNVIILMEFAERGALDDLIVNRRELGDAGLPEEEALDFFAQLLMALEHVHAARVLHRDLKPANIFLAEHSVIKLGDFGISRQLSTMDQLASTVAGTPYYFAPEVVSGKPYDYKADVWSAGCILYELLMLKRTFDGGSFPAIIMAIARNKWTPVPEDRASAAVIGVLTSMLNPDPVARPSIAQILELPVIAAAKARFLDRLQQLLAEEKTRGSSEPLPRNSAVSAAARMAEMRGLSISTGEMGLTVPAAGAPFASPHLTEPSPPAWGERGTGCYQWGMGARKLPQLYNAVASLEKNTRMHNLSLGAAHKAAVVDGGGLYTWADGFGADVTRGQLGHGDKASARNPKRVAALEAEVVVFVACGEHHCLAATASGRVFSWGANDEGQLGLGHRMDRLSPEELPALSGQGIVKLAAGTAHSVALSGPGALWTWGCNEQGQLGHEEGEAGGDPSSSDVPIKLNPKGEMAKVAIVDVACGGAHTAAAGGGSCFTWGNNEYAQLGRNLKADPTLARVPRRVKELADEGIDRVACGLEHTVALSTSAGTLFVWGRAASLGLGRSGRDVAVPAKMKHDSWDRSGERPAMITAGDAFSVVVTLPAGRVYAWGSGAEGRLGTGTERDAEAPILVSEEIFSEQEVSAVVASAHGPLTLALVHGYSGGLNRFHSSNSTGTLAAGSSGAGLGGSSSGVR